jgi:hypothetical protein
LRNAHGYFEASFDDGRISTCDTFTCAHCNRIVMVKPKQDAATIGGHCRQCDKLICDRCVADGRCTPLERRLAAAERSGMLYAEVRKTYGEEPDVERRLAEARPEMRL